LPGCRVYLSCVTITHAGPWQRLRPAPPCSDRQSFENGFSPHLPLHTRARDRAGSATPTAVHRPLRSRRCCTTSPRYPGGRFCKKRSDLPPACAHDQPRALVSQPARGWAQERCAATRWRVRARRCQLTCPPRARVLPSGTGPSGEPAGKTARRRPAGGGESGSSIGCCCGSRGGASQEGERVEAGGRTVAIC